MADKHEAEQLYGIQLLPVEEIRDMDAIVVCVQHEIFQGLGRAWFEQRFSGTGKKLLFDLKGMYDREEFPEQEYDYWRL